MYKPTDWNVYHNNIIVIYKYVITDVTLLLFCFISMSFFVLEGIDHVFNLVGKTKKQNNLSWSKTL